METIFTRKRIRLLIGFIILFLFILILAYSSTVIINPANAELLANFSIYFSGIVTPVFTFLSVSALIWTLKIQQGQFLHQQEAFISEQRKANFFSHIERFESKVEKFHIQARQPFGFSKHPDAIVLIEYAYMDPNSSDFEKITEHLIEIEKLTYFDDARDIPFEYRSDLLFALQLIDTVKSACRTLSKVYDLAIDDYEVVLIDLHEKATEIIHLLSLMQLQTESEQLRLEEIIKLRSPPLKHR